MRRRQGRIAGIATAVVLLAVLAGCGGRGVDATTAATARGPVSIWYSNNAQEVAWGQQAVAAWNAGHPDQPVSAEQIPAGKTSEAVISAAIVAGTEPCLIYNTSPAAVSGFQKEQGLVNLSSFPDGNATIESRTGDLAAQYKSPDGHYYQFPWKSNPVMLFYNKKVFAKAGLDPDHPALTTYADFLAAARKIVASKAAKYAIYPSPDSQFFQPWFDFYPMFNAVSLGKQLIENGKSQFDSPGGLAVAQLYRTLYAEKLAGNETYNGDAFADGTAAMAPVGPWAIANYKDKVTWGVVPMPTPTGLPASQIHTYSDAKNVGMYVSCQNRATAWDFLKFSTSVAQDGKLLELTGQMPLRTNLPATYASYFAKNPSYAAFAAQAARTVDVPNVPNSVEIWQTFRNAWTSSVIFGATPIPAAFSSAAATINALATESVT